MKLIDNMVDSADRGLAYGDGLFETIACIHGKLHNWSLHWQRFCVGADRLKLVLPQEALLLEAIQQKLQQANAPDDNKVVKIIISRGSGGRGYQFPESSQSSVIISIHDWPQRSASDYNIGIMVKVCQTCLAQQPLLSGIKHLNRLEQVMAVNELGSHYQECIMLACDKQSEVQNSRVIEATSSNLFFIKNEQLYTPEIDLCGVQGTMRRAVLQLAEDMYIDVQQGHYTLHDLLDAQEIFFTNSIYGIVPAASIRVSDNIHWSYRRTTLKSITAELSAVINKQLERPVL